MKTIRILSTMVLVTGVFAMPELRAGVTTVHDDGDHVIFYENLRPHGEWLEVEPGMLVWRPYRVHHTWRPYSAGRWVWTRHGWYWMSDEPYGWAVFHYGRWSMHPRYGWIWHPGRVWGPAWVEWRYSDTYIGWAPLPPFAVFHVSFGVRFTRHWVAPVDSWCFVSYPSFGAPIHRDRLLSHERVRRVIGSTRRGRTATIERDIIVNRGVERDIVERRGSIRVDRYEVTESRSGRADRLRDGRIEVYRPDRNIRNDERPARADPGYRGRGRVAPQEKPRQRSTREFTRPEQNRREAEPRSTPSRVPDRRVAPSVRSKPERSAPPPSSGTPDRPRSRKRDN